MSRKPMLATDAVESKLHFPLGLQPKIDGVRSLYLEDRMTGRSLKGHRNKHATEFFSLEPFFGFDGEMAAEHECHPDLCRLTSSALSTIEGKPWIMWHLFDYVTPATVGMPYRLRYAALNEYVANMRTAHPELAVHVRIMPMYVVTTLEELRRHHDALVIAGYEGSIIRDLDGPYKDGRSTVNEGWLLRNKDFVEEDAIVESVIEGETNGNDAQTNALGYIERSTHQENMIPNGMVGAMMCRLKTDVKFQGKKMFDKGQLIKVSAGRMTHDQRKHFFEHQDKLIGETIKFKFFPKGILDKPRFPTFQSFRSASDVV